MLTLAEETLQQLAAEQGKEVATQLSGLKASETAEMLFVRLNSD